MNKIYYLLLLLCVVSCSKSGDEDKSDDPANMYYETFPHFQWYYHIYMVAYPTKIELENTTSGDRTLYLMDEAASLLKGTNDWKLPDDAPYIFVKEFDWIRLIGDGEYCYKRAVDVYPDYFHYEYLARVHSPRMFELENIATKERKLFDSNEVHSLLVSQIKEWQIPNDRPYKVSDNNYISFNTDIIRCK